MKASSVLFPPATFPTHSHIWMPNTWSFWTRFQGDSCFSFFNSQPIEFFFNFSLICGFSYYIIISRILEKKSTPMFIEDLVKLLYHKIPHSATMVAQRLKHLPPMWETWVRSLGREDPLEKEMVNHSSTLAWRIPWIEKSGRLQSTGSQTERLHLHLLPCTSTMLDAGEYQ